MVGIYRDVTVNVKLYSKPSLLSVGLVSLPHEIRFSKPTLTDVQF